MMLIFTLDGHAFGQSRIEALSPACERIRSHAIVDYWKATVTPQQVARMVKAMRSANTESKGRALIGEALAGRITVQQFGASVLAGTDAVNNSALCVEIDRQIAKKFRLMLPSLMITLAAQISAKRRSKQ